MENKYLWQFFWDCGRSGCVEGLFVATEREVNSAIGKEVSFGEILGKHSDVYGTLEKGDLYKMDVSPEAVEEVAKHLGTHWSGYNPLDYVKYECSVCEFVGQADDMDFIEQEDGTHICYECSVKGEEV